MSNIFTKQIRFGYLPSGFTIFFLLSIDVTPGLGSVSVSLVGQVKHAHGPAPSTVMGKSVAKPVSAKMVHFVTLLMADAFVHQVRLFHSFVQ